MGLTDKISRASYNPSCVTKEDGGRKKLVCTLDKQDKEDIRQEEGKRVGKVVYTLNEKGERTGKLEESWNIKSKKDRKKKEEFLEHITNKH